jgi:hypothetical protein
MDTAGAMLGPLLAVGILSVAPQAYDAIFVVSLCVALIGLEDERVVVGQEAGVGAARLDEGFGIFVG